MRYKNDIVTIKKKSQKRFRNKNYFDKIFVFFLNEAT